MRKFIIAICLIGSALLILDSTGLFSWLFLFLMAGVIPGAKNPVSATEMLVVFVCIAVAVVCTVTISSIVHFISVDRLARKYMFTKKGLPRRRYSRA